MSVPAAVVGFDASPGVYQSASAISSPSTAMSVLAGGLRGSRASATAETATVASRGSAPRPPAPRPLRIPRVQRCAQSSRRARRILPPSNGGPAPSPAGVRAGIGRRPQTRVITAGSVRGKVFPRAGRIGAAAHVAAAHRRRRRAARAAESMGAVPVHQRIRVGEHRGIPMGEVGDDVADPGAGWRERETAAAPRSRRPRSRWCPRARRAGSDRPAGRRRPRPARGNRAVGRRSPRERRGAAPLRPRRSASPGHGVEHRARPDPLAAPPPGPWCRRRSG